MKVISIGTRYEIHDDSLKSYDELPAKTYTVRFAQMSGFYLGSAEKIKFSEYIRNGGKKVAYFRGLASNKFLPESIWHTDIQSSYIGLPRNRRYYGKTIDSGGVLLLRKVIVKKSGPGQEKSGLWD